MSKFTFGDASLESMTILFKHDGKDHYALVDIEGDVEIYRDSNGLQYGDYLSLNEDEFTIHITFLDEDENVVTNPFINLDIYYEVDKELNDLIISKLFKLKYDEVINEEY